ncbi:MAG: NAD(P)-dependent oxidoreductase [Proteobacteria bacterium]|jgi:nucleoside-diphosphate-sugar epimerase|nr:NAD(P)-dependent oxidoreductase [Pseudomonadota bacterium]
MKILLTGTNGFVGKHVLPTLNSHDVFCLSRNNLHEVKQFSPEMVINLAWEGVFSNLRNDSDLQAKNLVFNKNLFDICSSSCKRWVGIGSQIEINCPTNPYASYKIETRKQLELLSQKHGISFVWIRLFSIYGPGDKENNYIPYLVRELKLHHDPELTDQNIPWDYLYVTDAAEAIRAISFSEEEGIFNVGSGHTVLTQHVAKMIRDKISPNAVLQFGKRKQRAVELDYLCADITRLLGLGWRQTVSLEKGIDMLSQ